MNAGDRLREDREAIERALSAALDLPQLRLQKTVIEAMRYALLGGGKRIRGVLALETAEALGGSRASAMPAACALEMVHAYSLIHDDLPCMDDDDLRRGKPSCHIAFGEAMAVLAGDGLQTCAFELLSDGETVSLLGERRALALVRCISRAIGEAGMLGGQTADVENEGRRLSAEAHRAMVAMKTGALLCAAVECGCICADASAETTAEARRFGEAVGAAFQVTDDILDVVGDARTVGKPIGSDEAQAKNTFVTMLGLEGARAEERRLYAAARQSLARLCPGNEFLPHLLCALEGRRA